MIEMALVMMILLMLTFGTVDAGLYMYRFVQAANCTREAARRAAVRKDPTTIPFCVSNDLMPTVAYASDSSRKAAPLRPPNRLLGSGRPGPTTRKTVAAATIATHRPQASPTAGRTVARTIGRCSQCRYARGNRAGTNLRSVLARIRIRASADARGRPPA